MNPSVVYPHADQGATTSSRVGIVFWMSAAPMVITNGSLPGAKGTPLSWPLVA